MGLTTQEQILIEQRVTNEAKSIGAAYLLWFFLGGAGAHRFYLGQKTSGLIMLGLLVVGIITTPIMIGSVMLVILAIWAIVDAFLIPGMVQKQKDETRKRLTTDAQISSVAGIPVDTSKWSQADREKFTTQRVGRT
ncbi:TM2 domain-containing protein [Mesorhizobium sp.]|uniref:TM2 domain-containing protein n=1 Tax=Mesorhizobium sp. TaxID=1871066 RepID=UPI000FE49507|nr:TM2 domain-containing protein [Mesorhizobium sp.]RWB66579.1 MAG: TM2 domain-containing protein [Mesorhizobium sp.]